LPALQEGELVEDDDDKDDAYEVVVGDDALHLLREEHPMDARPGQDRGPPVRPDAPPNRLLSDTPALTSWLLEADDATFGVLLQDQADWQASLIKRYDGAVFDLAHAERDALTAVKQPDAVT
jgi:hypothetical protein